MADLDGFKRVNDELGHREGNRAIRRFADYLKKRKRAGDVAGRYGGDEFTVLLPDTKEQDAIPLANRLREDFLK